MLGLSAMLQGSYSRALGRLVRDNGSQTVRLIYRGHPPNLSDLHLDSAVARRAGPLHPTMDAALLYCT